MAPFGITIEVFSRSRDSDGDKIADTSKGTIDGVGFAPTSSVGSMSSVENTDHAAQIDTTASLFIPPSDVEVSAHDVIKLPNGDKWQVEGTPRMWSSPFTGWTPGGEIRIRRVTG